MRVKIGSQGFHEINRNGLIWGFPHPTPQPGTTHLPFILSPFVLIYYFCIFVHVFVTAHTEPSEDNVLESAVCHVGPGG